MKRAEVAVVGAGIIGALAAYELAKRGLEVLLLDAKKEGAATLASAGMLAPYPEGLSGELLEAALYGLRAYPDLLEELPSRVEAGFKETHVVALSKGEAEAWAAHREALPLDALPYPVRGGVGAWAFPGGYVHPAALRGVLLGAFQARGGVFLEAEVDRVAPGRLFLSSGEEVKARFILLAVGAWGGRFGLKVRPLRGEALLLEAPPPPAPLFAEDGYLLPREGGVYLGATSREGWGKGADLFGLRWLADYGHERFPLLEGARLLGVAWGYRPLGEVFVGEVDQGVYAATGHGRNGVLLAPWTAKRILE
ncbi:MAG: NAD(P)/FAD-dependent oxidoreductase, partial [Thermaceae bacterium]